MVQRKIPTTPLSLDDLIKQWLLSISVYCVKRNLTRDRQRVADMQLLLMDVKSKSVN